MGTSTSKGLYKPDPVGEDVDVADLNSNMDRVNLYGMGAFECTSTTRPTGGNRWLGQLIYETDTFAFGIWNGTKWVIYDTRWQSLAPSIDVGGVGIITPGNSIFFAKYKRNGETVEVQYAFQCGNTGVVFPSGGAGHLGVKLPPGYGIGSTAFGAIVAPIGLVRITNGSGIINGAMNLLATYNPTYAYVTAISSSFAGPAVGANVLANQIANSGNQFTAQFSYEALIP